MPTSATVLADSISEAGARLTTFEVKAPRFILSQLEKHRVFSLSCRSSRAVPVRKMIQEVMDDPVIPRFGKNQSGMRAESDLDSAAEEAARMHWLDARDDAVGRARELAELGVSKETANRLLEPFGKFAGVISSTDYINFFSLRISGVPHEVQAETRDLALAMARSYRDSTPVLRRCDDWREAAGWHLPYVTDDERATIPLGDLRMISAARAGRVSYVPHGLDAPDVAKDLARAAKMAAERHAVPFEHVACPSRSEWHRSGNFVGFSQMRQAMAGNVATSFDWSLVDRSW